MRYLRCLIMAACFFCFASSVKADCDYQRLSELSKIAGNVQFSYNYKLNNMRQPVFIVNISNVTNDIYIVDRTKQNVIASFDGTYTYESKGETLNYDIYSNDSNCKNQLIITRNVVLPTYNYYYNDEECQRNPEFKYCNLWYDTRNLSYEEFENAFQQYMDFELAKNDTYVDGKTLKKSNVFLSFISNNLLLVVLVIICLAGVPILVYLKRRL